MNATSRKKYFTVDEANQRLPLVRAIVEDIVQLFADVHQRRDRIARVRQLPGSAVRHQESIYSEELEQFEKGIEKDIARLDEYVQELRQLGVEFKDYVKGLVDFPVIIDGNEAYLCWMLGEGEITYWHELDAGFTGRQSLLEKSVSGDDVSEDV